MSKFYERPYIMGSPLANIIGCTDAIMTKPFFKTIRVKIKKNEKNVHQRDTTPSPRPPPLRPRQREMWDRDVDMKHASVSWAASRATKFHMKTTRRAQVPLTNKRWNFLTRLE